jgi:hypothetical protein
MRRRSRNFNLCIRHGNNWTAYRHCFKRWTQSAIFGRCAGSLFHPLPHNSHSPSSTSSGLLGRWSWTIWPGTRASFTSSKGSLPVNISCRISLATSKEQKGFLEYQRSHCNGVNVGFKGGFLRRILYQLWCHPTIWNSRNPVLNQGTVGKDGK